jgi:hypothetical protein
VPGDVLRWRIIVHTKVKEDARGREGRRYLQSEHAE